MRRRGGGEWEERGTKSSLSGFHINFSYVKACRRPAPAVMTSDPLACHPREAHLLHAAARLF